MTNAPESLWISAIACTGEKFSKFSTPPRISLITNARMGVLREVQLTALDVMTPAGSYTLKVRLFARQGKSGLLCTYGRTEVHDEAIHFNFCFNTWEELLDRLEARLLMQDAPHLLAGFVSLADQVYNNHVNYTLLHE